MKFRYKTKETHFLIFIKCSQNKIVDLSSSLESLKSKSKSNWNESSVPQRSEAMSQSFLDETMIKLDELSGLLQIYPPDSSDITLNLGKGQVIFICFLNFSIAC
jgi:hypothetical protein